MRIFQSTIVLAVILVTVAGGADSTRVSHTCHCLASNVSCWPTVEEWDAFNVSVSGRLIAPKPTGRPCHEPDPEAARCNYLRENYFNSYLRAENAGSMQNENWEDGDGSQTCSINAPARTPCYQGNVPVRGIQVEEIADVQAAIHFAAHHNLRVAVKTTGHDYLGRSTAAESFLIWLHKLKKNLTVHESFKTCGNSATPAITIAGGVIWGEVYDALNSTGYILVGGMGLTISTTGGYVQGGGHGALSPTFGLAVDGVVDIEVVTADGKLRLVNACHDPELFFALRGGGGGTFGVVTSVTYKLHRTPHPLVGILLSTQPPNSSSWTPETQTQILTTWASHAATLDTARWGGYWALGRTSFFAIILAPTTPSDVNSTLTKIIQTLSQIPHVPPPTSFTFQVSTFQEWHQTINSILFPKSHTDTTGSHVLEGSRIIPFAELTSHPRRVAQKLTAASHNCGLLIAILLGPGVRDGDPRQQTSVTPAFRDGIWHAVCVVSWEWNATRAEKTRARNAVNEFVAAMHQAFPDSGAYFNEASVDEPEWQRSLWGLGNYARLLVTKRRVDPAGMFVCRSCVGSELWDERGNCRLGFN